MRKKICLQGRKSEIVLVNENMGESRTLQEQASVFLNVKEYPKGLR